MSSDRRVSGVSAEERELLEALEKDGYESILTDARRRELEAYASETIKKNAINVVWLHKDRKN